MDYSLAFKGLATCDLSDACDALGIEAVTSGEIGAVYEGCRPTIGPVVTVELAPEGEGSTVIGTLEAICDAQAGSVVVFATNGRTDLNAWGSIAANAAVLRRMAGVVIDGSTRDVQTLRDLDFPTYARGTVVTSVRDRINLVAINQPIAIAGSTVHPGWLVAADENGVIFFPRDREQEIFARAWRVVELEGRVIREMREGRDPVEAHTALRYDGSIKAQLHEVEA